MRRSVLAFALVFPLAVHAAVPLPPRPATAALAQLGHVDELIRRSTTERDRTLRLSIADEAAALAEKIAAQMPADPRPLMLWARALGVSGPDEGEQCRPGLCEKAVALLQRARKLDASGIEAEQIESELGITLSRLQSFDAALAAYDRALTFITSDRRPNVHDDDADRTILYGNSAETLMALGRLDEAIERYLHAVQTAPPGDIEWQLAYWGLAVAYDRNEQRARAVASATRVLEHDPTMSRFAEEGVFFEPPGDRFFYEGLGHEVAGDFAEAKVGFARFVKELPASRYAARAREHLRDLKRRKSAGPDLSRLSAQITEVEQLRTVRSQPVLLAAAHRFEPPLKLCYMRVLRVMPQLTGQVRIGIEVSPLGWVNGSGHVILATLRNGAQAVESNEAVARSLDRCVEQVTAGWRFPAAPNANVSTAQPPELEPLILTIEFAPAHGA